MFGWFRKLLWLEVGPTNKMKEVVPKYYLDTVEDLGSSKVQSADDGTEHALMESIHIFNKELFYETEFIRSKFSKFSNVIIS